MEEDDESARAVPIPSNDTLVLFGRELRTAREARGLTRERLAERCGLSPSTVKKLEYGSGPQPRLETLIRLSAGLNVALIDLVSCVDPHAPVENRAKVGSTNMWLASLGEAQRELVIALIRVLACGGVTAGERRLVYAA